MTDYRKGSIITIIGAICWGFSGACAQFIFTNYHLSAETVTVYRMFFGGLILLLIAYFTDKEKTTGIIRNKSSLKQLLLFTIIGLIPAQLFYLITIEYSNAGTATVLQYCGPAIIMIYVCIKNRRLPKNSELIALTMVMLGVFMLATHCDLSKLSLSPTALFYGILSAFGFFFYSVIPADILKSYGSKVVTAYGLFIGSFITYIIYRPQVMISLDYTGYIALFLIISVGTIIAYSFYLYGTSKAGAERASIFACLEPVTATTLSFLVLNTAFVTFDFIGIILIIIAVIILK